MQSVKLLDPSGRKEQYLKAKIFELEIDIKTKNIRDLYGATMTLRGLPA